MADIVLYTLNARYAHAAFGLRYLLANLGPLRGRAELAEFDIHQRPSEIAEKLLARNPRIVGLGIYIWNVTPATEVGVAALKAASAGRDGHSRRAGSQPRSRGTGHRGAGGSCHHRRGRTLKFAEVAANVCWHNGERPPEKVIAAGLRNSTNWCRPTTFTRTRTWQRSRVIYVEASRGCPRSRASSACRLLDVPVRQFPLAPLLANLEELLRRGVRQFKFVDRTFNLNLNTSRALLRIFPGPPAAGLFARISEMIPDRLPEALRDLIVQFPARRAAIEEVGVQTFNPRVAELISRRQDFNAAGGELQLSARAHGGACPRGPHRRDCPAKRWRASAKKLRP